MKNQIDPERFKLTLAERRSVTGFGRSDPKSRSQTGAPRSRAFRRWAKQPGGVLMLTLLLCVGVHAQVNSGSNGSDGAFNPAQNLLPCLANRDTLRP